MGLHCSAKQAQASISMNNQSLKKKKEKKKGKIKFKITNQIESTEIRTLIRLLLIKQSGVGVQYFVRLYVDFKYVFFQYISK